MQSADLRKHHIKSFAKLSISERLDWALGQSRFLAKFMDPEAKKFNKKIRQYEKKYFRD